MSDLLDASQVHEALSERGIEVLAVMAAADDASRMTVYLHGLAGAGGYALRCLHGMPGIASARFTDQTDAIIEVELHRP